MEFIAPVNYVTSAPYFWGSMGFTTAIGMLLGGIFFVNVRNRRYVFRNSIILLLIFIFLASLVHGSRVLNYRFASDLRAWAGIVQNTIVGAFYIIGLATGFVIVNRRKA